VRVSPGAPVQDPESVVASAVAQAIRAGDPDAYSLLQSATARYGEGILRQIARAPSMAGNFRAGMSSTG